MDADYRLTTGLEGKPQYHIHCKSSDIAPIVLVPGDQERVVKITSKLSDATRIADNRGLITYTGRYKGFPISVTSTGMGGPSASIAYEELINIGAKVLIRVGSVGGLQEEVKEGDIVIPYGCIRDDGASQYYVRQNFPAVASPEIYQALIQAAEKNKTNYHTGINWTHSCFYNRNPEYFQYWSRRRVISMEMEASALFVVSCLRGIKAGFLGVCFANRYLQSSGDSVDLSVPDIERSSIHSAVDIAIQIALDASVDLYEQHIADAP